MSPLWFLVPAVGIGVWLTLGRPLAGSSEPQVEGKRGPLFGLRRWARAVLFLLAWTVIVSAVLSSWTKSGPRVILTEGSNEELVTDLEARKPREVVALDGGRWSEKLPAVEPREDLAVWLDETSVGVQDPIEVLGWGLHAWDWKRLELSVSRFEPPGKPLGLTEIVWPREVSLGAAVEVVGRLAGEGPHQVRLVGPGGVEDATEFDAGSDPTGFRVEAVPRIVGRTIYRLEIEDSDQNVEQREIALWVRESSFPAVLWIEQAPSFESREVRNWLTALGASIAVGSQITRGRSRWQQANFEPALETPKSQNSTLAVDLGRVDLLVIDPESWRRLGAPDRKRIEVEVSDSGLGVLVLNGGGVVGDIEDLPIAGLVPEEGPIGAIVPLGETSGDRWSGEPRPVHLTWDGAEDRVPPLLGLGHGWRDSATVHPLVVQPGGSSLVAWQTVGKGRVAGSRIHDTYSWILGGEAAHHRSFWSLLLRELARPVSGERWRLRAGPVLLDQPLDVWLDTGELEPEIFLIEPSGVRSRLSPWQELIGWRVTVHPREAGWHRVESAHSQTWVYVSAPTQWIDWDRAQRFRATSAASLGGQETQRTTGSRAPWFFVVGLLLLVLVWVDERLSWAL